MVNLAAEGAFIEFATVAEGVSKADDFCKTTLLSQYFVQLADDHLVHAVRYFTGDPIRDRPRSQIGELTLISAFSILTGAEPALLSDQQSELGDLAELAAQVVVGRSKPVLTIEDVAIALEQLGRTKGKRRLGWVLRLLEQATALEAKYLTKLMLGNLQAGLAEEVVEAAVAQISEQPLARIQRVHILLGDLGKTAILARRGQLDQARLQMFHPLKFMLASAVQDPAEVITQLQQGFAVETKYDGIRMQAHIAPADRVGKRLEETVFAGIRVALFSRTLQEMTASFPDLIVPLAALAPRALVSGATAGLILDGEIVPYFANSRPNFQAQPNQFLPFAALQSRLDQAPSEASIAGVSVAFIVYDVLYKDGTLLIDHPYQTRRAVLEALAMETPKVRLAEAQQFFDLEALEQQFLQARAQGCEGLMVKGLQSLYRPGRRSKDWLKVRHAIATLDVVVTAVEAPLAVTLEASSGDLSFSYFSTYAIAVRTSCSDGTLLNIGKVSAKLSPTELTELADWFDNHTLEEFADGRVRLVEPQLVLEITFERLRASPRHRSGYLLEQPKILRIRDDKPASEIDTLETLVQLAAPEGSEFY